MHHANNLITITGITAVASAVAWFGSAPSGVSYALLGAFGVCGLAMALRGAQRERRRVRGRRPHDQAD